MTGKGQLALVIGGGGFLGRHLCNELFERAYRVRVFDMRETYKDERLDAFHVGDLTKREDMEPALQGVDVVFHCASPSPLCDNRKLFQWVNVEGSRRLVALCEELHIPRLVLTSSASVLYEGRDIENATEDTPYAKSPADAYSESKIEQESIVLSANKDTFRTIAVRPHGIFGPHDPHLVPTLVAQARAGKTRFVVGNGKNMVDFTYVRNVAVGHVLAAESLADAERTRQCAGQAYHITNDAPIPFWAFMGDLLEGLGFDRPKYNLPFWLLYGLACIVQFFVVVLSPIKKFNPTMNPMKIALAGTHHYYSCERAKKDLGYKPVVSVQEGIKLTIAAFPECRKDAINKKD